MLSSPHVAVLAWLVFPLLALAICLGIGLLAERAAGVRLEPALLPATGFAAAVVVLAPLMATGAGGVAGCVVLVVAGVAGMLLARRGLVQRLTPGLGGLAGVAVYALYIAPVALSGTVTFLGYNLLNDTAIHLALVDWIGDHGSRYIQQAPSSYGAAIHDYAGTHYPLGSHELLAALKPLVGLDPARIYQPFLAFSAACAACAVYALARGSERTRRVALLVAVAALGSQLVFSFALQGGIKEISFITCLAAAAALGASGEVRLMALAAAALYAIYGVYALPWIAPLGLAALWLVRPAMRTALAGVGVFLLGIAVLVPDSISYYRHGHDVITSGSELGPLGGPLKPVQAAGLWLNGDYRFTPPHAWITYALIAVALVLAAYGAFTALRARTRGPLLLLLPALVAWALTAPASSPYIDAKLLAILSPAVILFACLGAAALPLRRAAIAAAVVLGAALLVSDALAYRIAIVAPAGRLGELAAIDKRFAGKGPVLVNEYEEYVKHYMRRSRGSDPYEGWNAGRAELRDSTLPVGGHAYDLDQLRTSFIERWPLIALRRSPVESRPPSNYDRVWSGRWYDVWQRDRPAPVVHVALGKPPFDPTGPLDCALVRRMASQGRVIAAIRQRPRIVPVADILPLPPGWLADLPTGSLSVNKGGRIATTVDAHGSVRIWLRGRAFRPTEVLADGKRIGIVRGINGPNQWLEAGAADLGPGEHRLELVRPKRSLRPGDAQRDVIGPVAIVSDVAPRLVSGPALDRVCGLPADWIDVAGP
ncbi:MAG: hypothetical protein QOH13_2782 [Thermoleophilaceae bacterium]|nr:hypothetical protein [Thermoleophilaceae bacterium]